MDLDVIKEQLGNFKTFVESMSGALTNFPAALSNFAALIGIKDGDVETKANLMDHSVKFGQDLGTVRTAVVNGGVEKWDSYAPKAK